MILLASFLRKYFLIHERKKLLHFFWNTPVLNIWIIITTYYTKKIVSSHKFSMIFYDLRYFDQQTLNSCKILLPTEFYLLLRVDKEVKTISY